MPNSPASPIPLCFVPKGANGAPCPHTNGKDVIEMAEKAFSEKGIHQDNWVDYRGIFTENLPDYMWKSIEITIEWKGGKWNTKNIDRREVLSDESTLGFKLEKR